MAVNLYSHTGLAFKPLNLFLINSHQTYLYFVLHCTGNRIQFENLFNINPYFATKGVKTINQI